MTPATIHRESWQRALLAILSVMVLCPAWGHAAAPFPEFIDPNPNPGNQFGSTVVALSTGNVVITSPYDDAGGTDAGAVYLFNGANGALISTLKGSQANDNVGNYGVTALSNGNYVVSSPSWDNDSVVDAGAVTWGSGASGVNGVVSSSNSLTGSQANDDVGRCNGIGVTALSNGNYVVSSSSWDNASVVNAGAVTWGSGTSGVSGIVSSGNSLVGTKAGDLVGYYGVTALTNSNYVVSSPYWDNASVVNAGAVTWGSGTSGVNGPVSSSNSLFGTHANDQVGYGINAGLIALSNGNYVVSSFYWDNVSVVDAGAVTWGSGITGVSGAVSSSNSLVGTHANDQVGYSRNNTGLIALSNANYVVCSGNWDNAGVVDAGAVTWGSGSSGVNGEVSSSNSLVGTQTSDQVGTDVTALTNGNYVVSCPYWDNAGVANAGAVIWGPGVSGVSGPVTTSNSLVGTKTDDLVGYGVTALSNGNYVVVSPYWDNASVAEVGAVTWVNGSSEVSGVVASSNSLIGTQTGDTVGSSNALGCKVTPLSNGNYVVSSPSWDNDSVVDAGAVTWGSGTSGVSGIVSSGNSLVGTKAGDLVGFSGVTALNNGNYVVAIPNWNGAGAKTAGAVTWGSGTSGVSGPVSSSNSLVGTLNSEYGDHVGMWGVTALNNGNYVIASPQWSSPTVLGAGAVTWGSGTSGVSGAVSSSNSLVGTNAGDSIGGLAGGGVTALSNGNYLVISPYWNSGAGAVTWGSGTSGVNGAVTNTNSHVGLTSGGSAWFGGVDDVNSTYFVNFTSEGGGRVRLGSQIDGLAIVPDIFVAQTSPLIDASGGVPFGSVIVGSSTPLIFTITNPVGVDLTSLVVTKNGSDAAYFTVSALSATGIPVGAGTATFTVTFSPSSGGVKTAAIHIASNVIGTKNPFDISLNGTALTFTDDTDADGLNDASEFQMVALGFDWQVSQPALVSTYLTSANGAGYFTASQVQALNVGTPLIQKNPTTGIFTLTLGVTKSADLNIFNPFPMTGPGTSTVINGAGNLEFQFTVPDNAAFFKVQAQ
jgi:hypothetical protein